MTSTYGNYNPRKKCWSVTRQDNTGDEVVSYQSCLSIKSVNSVHNNEGETIYAHASGKDSGTYTTYSKSHGLMVIRVDGDQYSIAGNQIFASTNMYDEEYPGLKDKFIQLGPDIYGWRILSSGEDGLSKLSFYAWKNNSVIDLGEVTLNWAGDDDESTGGIHCYWGDITVNTNENPNDGIYPLSVKMMHDFESYKGKKPKPQCITPFLMKDQSKNMLCPKIIQLN